MYVCFTKVWTHVRTDILSVLIWVKTVCKGYQQTTKVAASKIFQRQRSALKDIPSVFQELHVYGKILIYTLYSAVSL